MIEQANLGRTVIRLKGGDPFIFGRGGEELEALRAHGIDYEVVPGITAALGCAAYAGIPLTHRDHAKAVTFVTGHSSVDQGADTINWSEISGPDRTTVIYMGVGQAGRIRADLLKAGINRRLPVAIVMDGTRDTQRVVHGTVDTLPVLAQAAGTGAPALLIIGQVAALGSTLAWFTERPNLKTAA
jgi:uroporphyrin-III C-methyltransferase/precorrin-2 dehydrogenase/sirohydrochlorin ferrochelatase